MTQVILVNASTQPWTVELLSSGGNGAVGTTGANPKGGGGGGACGYAKLTYLSGTFGSTVAFVCPTGGSQNNQQWQDTGGTNAQTMGSGRNAVTSTGGTGGTGSVSTNGSPAVLYTRTTETAGTDGGTVGGTNRGGGGGSGVSNDIYGVIRKDA